MTATPPHQHAHRRMDHGAHVLVVEDHPVTLHFLTSALEENGYRVTQAVTAAEGIAALDLGLPDLLVLDLHLPDIYGLEVCRHLRELLGGEDIPVLVVTTEEGSQGHAEAVRAGVDDFLRKPIHPVELKTRARSLLRLRFLWRDLRTDRESILKMQAQKENLLQFVAHDLKNLLSAAQAALDLMGESRELPQAQRFQAHLGGALQTMLGMVTDLLDISIGDRAELVLGLDSFLLGPWLERVVHEFEPLAGLRRQSFSLQVAPDLWVDADPHLLRRVISNLLENAVRFAPEGSPIQVSVRPGAAGRGPQILVCDRGPGIPVDQRHEIFDRYVRLNSREENRSGRGLGLAFCRLVMDMHQGRIWVEDNEPQGSRFVLELPGEAEPPA